MARTETKMDQLKIGDLVFTGRDWMGRSCPAKITKITNHYVFYNKITPPKEHAFTNNPEFVEKCARWNNLKGVKTWGDQYNGGASIPLKGNEHYLVESETAIREKITSKYRGTITVGNMYVIDPDTATVDYDFYIGQEKHSERN